jgi:2-aminoadipate transaminase
MADPAPIAFARGAPSLDIVDVEGLREAADRALTSDPGGSLGYGTAWGYGPLRKWIAEQHGVVPEQVIVTNGSMQADAFLFETLVEPGSGVVVESPSYDRTLASLQARGAVLYPVGLEDDGIDVAELERELEDRSTPVLAHIIPNFHNPAGCTLSGPKRRRLLELAREYEFTIFEDDPYYAIRFTGEPHPRMLDLAQDGEVVYASSFSKTVCPGMRVGYLVGPEPIIDRIRKLATSTYISPSMISQSIVYQFAVSGALDRSIENVRNALRGRVETLSAALKRDFPDARFVTPDGGYFLWLELPEDVDVDKLFTEAAKRGVQFVKGTDFMVDGGQHALRLAYSGVTSEQIDEGITRLAAARAAIA